MECKNAQPMWLERAYADFKRGRLDMFTVNMQHVHLHEILEDSCYYLSAGADITPIIAFKDIIYSYIFCDYYLYNSLEGISDKFLGILIKVKDRLIREGFKEIQKFNLDNNFLKMKIRRYANGYVSKMKNCEISFWIREDKLYSLLYINHDNTCTYKDLYIKNGITPKALCEILSEGGSLRACEEGDRTGAPTLTVEEKKNVLPEYLLGHRYSIGDVEQYDELSHKPQYFGDYGPEYGSRKAMVIYKKRSTN